MSVPETPLSDPLALHREHLVDLVETARVDLADRLNAASVWLEAAREAVSTPPVDVGSFEHSAIEFEAARAQCAQSLRLWQHARAALESCDALQATVAAPVAIVEPVRAPEPTRSIDRTARLGELGDEMVEAADETACGFTAFASALNDLVRPPDGSPPWSGDGSEVARLLALASQASANLHGRLREFDEVIACAGSA